MHGFRSARRPCLLKKSKQNNFQKVTRGFEIAHSPCWPRKSLRKQSRCRLGNHHRNSFQRWGVDSKDLAPLWTQKKSMKTKSMPTGKSSPKHLPKVTHGLGSAHSPCWLRKTQRKQSRWWLGNHHRNPFKRWDVDSEGLTAPIYSEKVYENGVGADWKSSPKNLPKVTRGFGRARTPVDWKTSTKTESMPTGKSSPKHLQKVTLGFERARSSYWLKNINKNGVCPDWEIVT